LRSPALCKRTALSGGRDGFMKRIRSDEVQLRYVDADVDGDGDVSHTLALTMHDESDGVLDGALGLA